jgi:cytochrome P450
MNPREDRRRPQSPPLGAVLEQPPPPDRQAGVRALQILLRERDILPVLQAMHESMGDVFRLPLPGFNPVVLVGPEANRFVHVTARDDLLWRMEGDPITRLLRHGLLVEDGHNHDWLRRLLTPALRRQRTSSFTPGIIRATDRVSDSWQGDSQRDMLVEMRRVALLALMDTLFDVDFSTDMPRLWPSILYLLKYISPGLWLIWPGIPRPGYRRAQRELDTYLYKLIQDRRRAPTLGEDMLSSLVAEPGVDDELIRDQMLTMLIAGHDTCTALLTWALYLLGTDGEAMGRARSEVDALLGTEAWGASQVEALPFLNGVVKETLRLYPPVHLGMRIAARDLTFRQYRIPAGSRVIYSIYLTHHRAENWPDPDRFSPDRFSDASDGSRPPYSYIPFGGGPRNCIGSSFGLIETKTVLARLLQKFDLEYVPGRVQPHMGATLEPRPGVLMRVKRRVGSAR